MMITRIPDAPNRSEAVAWDKLVLTVTVADDNSGSMYQQAKEAFANIDKNLKALGTDKTKILSTIVYIADMARKEEMNRAWDEWADAKNPPMRACLGVALTGKDLIEVIVTAVR
jgi:enamine deaminase RidA (YjgF/YER057c/UK114 family)